MNPLIIKLLSWMNFLVLFLRNTGSFIIIVYLQIHNYYSSPKTGIENSKPCPKMPADPVFARKRNHALAQMNTNIVINGPIDYGLFLSIIPWVGRGGGGCKDSLD